MTYKYADVSQFSTTYGRLRKWADGDPCVRRWMEEHLDDAIFALVPVAVEEGEYYHCKWSSTGDTLARCLQIKGKWGLWNVMKLNTANGTFDTLEELGRAIGESLRGGMRSCRKVSRDEALEFVRSHS